MLIITYYWPPAGGSGVQRWLKFVKNLQDFGVQPVVYTVADENYPKQDHSLIDEIPENIEILKQPIWKPTDIISWNSKSNGTKSVSNATNNKLFSFIRGNFFIPDPKVFWVNKSVKFIKNYLLKNKIDVIISTGPPHSMHLIAKKVAENSNVKWVADFRDPWTNLYYNNSFKQLPVVRRINLKLEREVLKKADCVLTVSDSLKSELDNYSKRVEVITNGYDDDNLLGDAELDKKFTISYIGLLPPQSHPQTLFEILSELCTEHDSFANDIQLNFVGDISNLVSEAIERKELKKYTKFYGYVSHQEAIRFQKQSQVLLLLIPNVSNSEGILTGKFFEYLTSKRPILAMGPKNGDLDKILKETKSGVLFGYDEKEDLKQHILALYQKYKEDNLLVKTENIEKYHRKNLTKQLVTILKSLHS